MRSFRNLVAVFAATLLAFSVLGSSASASSKAFHLTKTCSIPGALCTVLTSSFKEIPAGTDITYTWASTTIAYPTIVIRNGSTTGVCDWNQVAPIRAKCTFGTGTGRLTQFHLAVDVTNVGTLWLWDGVYWSGNGD